MPAFKAIQGTRDILPDAAPAWQVIETVVRATCERYGYQRIETPIFEETGVYARGVGEGTDIVEKEMYTFKDRGGTSLTLEPEGTAGVVRAYLEHGMFTQPQPVKLYYLRAPIFRYERPQKGRLREHHQFGCEALGEEDPALDAEMIALLWEVYQRLGARDIVIQLNSIGDRNCRPAYIQRLVDYYTPLRDDLCDDCKVRLVKNPLRLLDCKEERDQPKIAAAPKSADFLCEPCAAHFAAVRAGLDALDLPYTINPLLVRGLDYYTRTVFELAPEISGRRQSAIGGGGRYDGLAELLGGKPTPGIGFGAGMERAIDLLREQGVLLPALVRPQVFIAALGAEAKMAAQVLARDLRAVDLRVQMAFGERSLKAQMKAANNSGAHWAVLIGSSELASGAYQVRDLAAPAEVPDNAKQHAIPRADLVAWLLAAEATAPGTAEG
jgi:histidyl-tRNA synthetase